jgi:hypothetical protein
MYLWHWRTIHTNVFSMLNSRYQTLMLMFDICSSCFCILLKKSRRFSVSTSIDWLLSSVDRLRRVDWRCCGRLCMTKLNDLLRKKYLTKISRAFTVRKEIFIRSQFRKCATSRRVVRKRDLFILERIWLNPLSHALSCSQDWVLTSIIDGSRSGLSSMWQNF